MNEDDMCAILRYPHNMVGADGGVQDGQGMPHPRSYGTNARILGKLKSVLHSWDDEHCRQILRNCWDAMAKDARLMLVERILPARMHGGAGDRTAARSDLHMLLGSGGLERTRAEFVVLLADTGIEAKEFIRAGLDHWVIEAARR